MFGMWGKRTTPRIAYVQYFNPAAYPPLVHSSLILANRGWQVMFLGIGSVGADSLTATRHGNVLRKRFHGCPHGWRQKLHFIGYLLWVFYWVIRWRPNVIYASDLLANPVVWVIGWVFRGPIVYHEHDTPADDALMRLDRVWKWFRVRLARKADFYVLPNEARMDIYRQTCKPTGRGFCVWNCPVLAEVTPSRLASPLDRIRVLYHGSVNPERVPLRVLDALKLAPDKVSFEVVGYTPLGSLGYFEQMSAYAAKLGVTDRFRIIGPMSRTELMEHCRQCDVGLAFMPMHSKNINYVHSTGASNKPYDYLAGGLALLVSDLPDWHAMFVSPGYGLACDPTQVETIAKALQWCAANADAVRVMGERGRQRIAAEWNYNAHFAPLLKELENAIHFQAPDVAAAREASAAV